MQIVKFENLEKRKKFFKQIVKFEKFDRKWGSIHQWLEGIPRAQASPVELMFISWFVKRKCVTDK